LTQQRRRDAAEQQEFSWRTGPVDQHTQRLEQLGGALNLVDHDQAAQVFQRGHRLGELRFDLRIFEIETTAGLRRSAARTSPCNASRISIKHDALKFPHEKREFQGISFDQYGPRSMSSEA